MSVATCPPEYLAEHYNGRIFKCYYVYVSARFGRSLFEGICRELDVSVDFVIDSSNWFSDLFNRKFTALLKERTGEGDIAFKAGALFACPEVLSPVEYLVISSIASPRLFFQSLPRHYSKFNRINDVKIVTLRHGECTFEVVPKRGLLPPLEVCTNTISVLLGIKNIFDLKDVDVKHDKCIHNGHSACEFLIKYSPNTQRWTKLLKFIKTSMLFLAAWFCLNCLSKTTLNSEFKFLIEVLFSSSFAFLPILIKGYLKRLNHLAIYFQQNLEVSHTLYQERIERMGQMTRLSIAKQVAHDIRSPLSALEVAVSDIKSIDTALVERAVSRIKEISASILKPQIESYVPCPTDVSFSISDIIQEKIFELKKINKNIDFLFIPPPLPCRANIKPAVLSRILSNLINNSIDSILGSGKVYLNVDTDDSNVYIYIGDDGVGIPREQLALVTSRGFTVGKAGGYGLGLSGAKAALESIGGSLKVSSIGGEGTKVTLILPKFKN